MWHIFSISIGSSGRDCVSFLNSVIQKAVPNEISPKEKKCTLAMLEKAAKWSTLQISSYFHRLQNFSSMSEKQQKVLEHAARHRARRTSWWQAVDLAYCLKYISRNKKTMIRAVSKGIALYEKWVQSVRKGNAVFVAKFTNVEDDVEESVPSVDVLFEWWYGKFIRRHFFWQRRSREFGVAHNLIWLEIVHCWSILFEASC